MKKELEEVADLNFEEILKSNKNVVIDFYATWCGPCKIIAPLLEELAFELNPDVFIYKMDVDQNSETVKKAQIKSLPTVLFFKDGITFDRQIGATTKTVFMEKIKNLIQGDE